MTSTEPATGDIKNEQTDTNTSTPVLDNTMAQQANDAAAAAMPEVPTDVDTSAMIAEAGKWWEQPSQVKTGHLLALFISCIASHKKDLSLSFLHITSCRRRLCCR